MSGEVCSAAVASNLGITANNTGLCETITTTTVAPFCILDSNAGFGFTRSKSSLNTNYDSCITAECPTDFKVDPKNKNKCLKKKTPNMTLLNNINEERWYDWFMIPDHHLHNKYQRVDNINYAPCKKGSIPSYEIDPVDQLKKTFNSSNKDDFGKCVEKSKYFGGKYFNSETHCPLAWVYRVGATNKDLKAMYGDLINEINDTKRGNKYLDTLTHGIDTVIHDEIYKPVIEYGFNDYIGPSQTDEAKFACSRIEQDKPERREKAFIICNTIKEVGEEPYIEKLMRENNEDKSIAKKKYKRAIQACDTLFCNDNVKNLCFPEVEKKDFNNNFKKIDEKPPEEINTEIEKTKVSSFTLNGLIVIGVIFASMVLYVILKPIIKYIIKKLRENITIKKIFVALGYSDRDLLIAAEAKLDRINSKTTK